MRKSTKKTIAAILAASVMVCNFSTIVSASTVNENEIINFETYAQILTDAYAKEGVEIEIIRPTEAITITKSMLNDDLSKVKELAEDVKKSSTTDTEYIVTDQNENTPLSSNIQPRAMYGTVNDSDTYYLIDLANPALPRTATIDVFVTIYGDIGNCTILEGYSPSLNIVSATGYDDYIALKSYSTHIDNSSSTVRNHSITYTITCELKEELSIGIVTSWAKVDKTFSLKFKPF